MIKTLIASGPNVVTSTIEFGKKLTIIAGPSDTGKTCIYKRIDYIFGGNNDASNLPFDENDGYNTISVVLETHKGLITLTRKQKSSITAVVSEAEGIESGDYVLKETKANSKTINSLFLKLIDAPINLKLPCDDKGKSASFTWRTIKVSFIVDEHKADTKKSVLIDVQNQSLYLASLIYMISGNELSECKGDKEAEIIKKAKKIALLEYITKQRKTLERKKDELKAKLQIIPESKTAEELIKALNLKIDSINAQIDKAAAEFTSLNKEKIKIEDRLIRNKALIDRYSSLATQYNTDINRLTFIVDNEGLIKKKTKKTKCPYCDSEIMPVDQSSYIQASQAELVKAVTNSQELEETRIVIQSQIDDDEFLAKDYEERLSQIHNIIEKEYLPQSDLIAKQIQQLQDYLQIEASLAILEESDNELSNDIKTIQNDKISTFTPFKGKQIINDLISSQLEKECRIILEQIGYTPIESVEFSSATLDLTINGKAKMNRGKGFNFFINSLLLLSFRKFMNDYSEKCYNFYMFDSPLKGLSLPDDDVAPNIRAGFFKYLTCNDLNDQVIIIENTHDGELPQLQRTKI